MKKPSEITDPHLAGIAEGIDELAKNYNQILLELKESREALINIRYHTGLALTYLKPLEKLLPDYTYGEINLTHGQLSLNTSLEIIGNTLGDAEDIEEAEKKDV